MASGLRGILVTLLFVLLIFVWACPKKAPPAVEEGVRPGGVFADVIEAIGQIKSGYPGEEKRDRDVSRSEWELIVSARKQFLVPLVVSGTASEVEYSQPEGTGTGGGDGTQGDALDVILDAEWDEYKNLVASMPPDAPAPELSEEVKNSLNDFYRDLPMLMEGTPDGLRERVIHIVALRYYNTILRAGAVPPGLSVRPAVGVEGKE